MSGPIGTVSFDDSTPGSPRPINELNSSELRRALYQIARELGLREKWLDGVTVEFDRSLE